MFDSIPGNFKTRRDELVELLRSCSSPALTGLYRDAIASLDMIEEFLPHMMKNAQAALGALKQHIAKQKCEQADFEKVIDEAASLGAIGDPNRLKNLHGAFQAASALFMAKMLQSSSDDMIISLDRLLCQHDASLIQDIITELIENLLKRILDVPFAEELEIILRRLKKQEDDRATAHEYVQDVEHFALACRTWCVTAQLWAVYYGSFPTPSKPDYDSADKEVQSTYMRMKEKAL